jgi:hypothetical protein
MGEGVLIEGDNVFYVWEINSETNDKIILDSISLVGFYGGASSIRTYMSPKSSKIKSFSYDITGRKINTISKYMKFKNSKPRTNR